MSASERAYMALDRVFTPCVGNIVVEGTGQFDLENWRKAVEIASAANPGSRLVLRGRLGWSRLVDSGITPPVRVIDAPQWSGYSPEGADFLSEPLPLREGSTCEVILLPGEPSRVIFRTHHSVMDGGGLYHWARDIFHALNHRPLIGSALGISDKQLAMSIRTHPPKHWKRAYAAPTGKSEIDEDATTWRRIHIDCHYSLLLPKIALYVAQRARQTADEQIHIALSVDMRKHIDVAPNTGNLTGFIHILVAPHSTPESIGEQIRKKLEDQEYTAQNPGTSIAVHLPLSLLVSAVRNTAAAMRKDGLFGGSAILSNIGRLDLATFTSPDFLPRNGYVIPPGSGLSPAMTMISGTENGLDIVVAMPVGLATRDRIDNFLQEMKDFLREHS